MQKKNLAGKKLLCKRGPKDFDFSAISDFLTEILSQKI
jgi:hypothetical protein